MIDNAARSHMYLSLRKTLASLCIVLTGLVILFFAESSILQKLSQHFYRPSLRPFYSPRPSSPSNIPTPRLHFLLPAKQSDLDVCKALTSSFILDYPLPTMIGWNSSGDQSHISKIVAVNAFLRILNDTDDDDLLLMVDGLDTWFQLPVSVLLSRYYAENAQASSRSSSAGHKQSIILAAEKKCWPSSDESLTCSQAPDPPLPMSLFGTQTDEFRSFDSSNPFQFLRPRYLNSGFLMGPVRDVRALYTRASEKVMKEGEKLLTDQGVLGRVWAEQEVVRGDQWARGIAAASAPPPPPPPPTPPSPHTSRPSSNSKKHGSHKFEEARHTNRSTNRRQRREYKEPWHPEARKNYEFGMGLDYEGSLSMTTQWAWTDAEWVTLSNVTEIQAAVDSFKITDPRIKPGAVPSDLREAGAPFQKLEVDGVKDVQWEDVSLYTNLWTGVVPVTIHHNAMPDGETKILRNERWGSMWYAGNVRQMFEERAQREAAKEQKETGAKGRYRVRRSENRLEARSKEIGVRTLSHKGEFGWATWPEMCGQDIRKEIFG